MMKVPLLVRLNRLSPLPLTPWCAGVHRMVMVLSRSAILCLVFLWFGGGDITPAHSGVADVGSECVIGNNIWPSGKLLAVLMFLTLLTFVAPIATNTTTTDTTINAAPARIDP